MAQPDERSNLELFVHEIENALDSVRELKSSLCMHSQQSVALAGSGPVLRLSKACAFYSSKLSNAEYLPLLISTGDCLYGFGEYWAADKLAYGVFLQADGCTPISGSATSALPIAQAAELRVRAYYGSALCETERCKASDPRVRFPATLESLVAAMSSIQRAIQNIIELGSCIREQLYHLIFNGTVHLFTIAESLTTLGYGERVVDFLNYAVLSMECVASLSTTRYLPWRTQLYTAICSCYESNNKPAAALAAAVRLRDVAIELRHHEEMDPPLPTAVLTALDNAELAAATHELKYTLLSRGFDDMTSASGASLGSILAAKLGMELDGSAESGVDADHILASSLRNRFVALLVLLCGPQRRVLCDDPSTPDELSQVAADISRLCQNCFDAELFVQAQPSLSPVDSKSNCDSADVRAHTFGTTSSIQNHLGGMVDDYARPSASLPYKDAASGLLLLCEHVNIAKMLFRFGQYGAFCTVAASASHRIRTAQLAHNNLPKEQYDVDFYEELSIYEKELEIMEIFRMLQSGTQEDSSAVEVDGESEEISERNDELAPSENAAQSAAAPLVAEVDGKVIHVQILDSLAVALTSCTRGAYRVMCKRRPDFLSDAVLRLWSPFCTAMLSTIGSLSPDDVVAPALHAVTVRALFAVVIVGEKVKLHDTTILATASLQLANLLHFGCKDNVDSRCAIQVLKGGIRLIENARRECVDADLRGNDAISDYAGTLTKVSLTASSDFKGAVVSADSDIQPTVEATLAALHADLTMMLMKVELDLGSKNSAAVTAHAAKLARHKTREKGVYGHGTKKSTKTPAVADRDPQPLSTNALCESRLLSECKRNKYNRALLLMRIAEMRSELHEQVELLSEAADALRDARSSEEALMREAGLCPSDSIKPHDHGTADNNATLNRSIPPRPLLVSRTPSSITLRVVPFIPIAKEKGSRKARHDPKLNIVSYAIYGKPAGAGTDVSLNNTDLLGTGVPVAASENMIITIDRLVANEAYVFAVTAFGEDGDVIGGVGETTLPIEALAPLPLLLCWGLLCKIASSIATVARQATLVNRTNLALCEGLARTSASELFQHFVAVRSQRDLWAMNPLDAYTLIKARVCRASRPILQTFVQTLFVFADLCGQVTSSPGVASVESYPGAFDPHRSMVPAQVEMLLGAQRMLVALEVATMLPDNALVIEAASRAYRFAAPLLAPKFRGPMAYRVLVTIQQALKGIGIAEWTPSTCKLYARASHGLLQMSVELEEMHLAVHVLMGEQTDTKADSDNDARKVAFAPALTEEQRQLESFMQLQPDFVSRGTNSIRDSVGRAAIVGESDVDQNLSDSEPNTSDPADQLPDIIWEELAKSGGGGLDAARNLLLTDGNEQHPRFLELAARLCRSALLAGRHQEAGEWAYASFDKVATFAAEANNDVEPNVDVDTLEDGEMASKLRDHPLSLDLVQDVLLEENLEGSAPFTSTKCLEYPLSEDHDPLELSLINRELPKAEFASTDDTHSALPGLDGGAVALQATADDGESEEEKAARVAAETEIKAKVHIRARWLRFLDLKRVSTEAERASLVNLAELELIRAQSTLELWKLVPAFPKQPESGKGLCNGPLTDLSWALTDDVVGSIAPAAKPAGESGEGATGTSVQVPPLGIGKIDEDGTPLSQRKDFVENPVVAVGLPGGVPNEGVAPEHDSIAVDSAAVHAADRRARRKLSELLNFSARAAVRARWAHSWLQLQCAGKILWNGLWYGWVSPEDFVDASDDTTTQQSSLTQRSGHDSSRSSSNKDDDAVSTRTAEVEPTSAVAERKPTYDWKPIWRTTYAALDMLEVFQGEKSFQSDPNVSSDVVSIAGIDMLWLSRLVFFTLQMLCHLKKWPQLVSLGDRFNSLTDCVYAEPVQALIIHAQRQLWLHSSSTLAHAKQKMKAFVDDWHAKHKKKKRRNQRKARALVKVEEKVSEAERQFQHSKSEFQTEVDRHQKRVDELQLELNRQQRVLEQLFRDKNNCLEELHGARRLRDQALRHEMGLAGPQLARGDASGDVKDPNAGEASVRTGRMTRRTRRTVASSRTGRTSNRSYRSRAAVSSSRDNLEWQRGPHLRGTLFDAACGAYTKAAVLARQKQETLLMVQALQEFGDLHFGWGGATGLKAARRAWTDAVDGVVAEVDSPQNWRVILLKACNKISKGDAEVISPSLLLESFGMVGCAAAGVNLCKLAKCTFSSDSFQQQEHLLMASKMLSAVMAATVPHPTRTIDFAGYKVREICPSFNLFADPVRLPVTSLVSSLRYASNALIWSGSISQALDALPLLAMYEYVCSDVCSSLRGMVDARVLRVEALVILGQVNEASRAIASIITGDGLAGSIYDLADDSQAPDSARSGGAVQASKGIQGYDLLANHLSPWDDLNQNALAWLKDSSVGVAPHMIGLVGPHLIDRLVLAKTKLLLRIAASSDTLPSSGSGNVSEEETREQRCIVIDSLWAATEASLVGIMEAHALKPLETSLTPPEPMVSTRSGAPTSARSVVKATPTGMPHAPICSMHSLLMRAEAALLRARAAVAQGLHSVAVKVLRSEMELQAQEEPRCCAALLGGPVKADSGCENAVAPPYEVAHPRSKWWLECRLLLSRALLSQGRYDEAKRQSELGISEAQEIGECVLYCSLSGIKAELRVHAGELAAALDTLDDVIFDFAPMHHMQHDSCISELRVFAAELRREQAAVIDLESSEGSKLANSLEQQALEHLEAASEAISKELYHQGWNGTNYAGSSGLPSELGNMYLPGLPGFAVAQLRLGTALADKAKRESDSARLTMQRRAFKLLQHGLAVLAQSTVTRPSLQSELLLQCGRLQRQLLPYDMPAGKTRFPSPTVDRSQPQNAELPADHPVASTARSLSSAVTFSLDGGGHDYTLMHAACMELFLLFGSRLVDGFETAHGQAAIHWLRTGAAVLEAQHFLIHEVSALSEESVEDLSSLPTHLKSQVQEACASSLVAENESPQSPRNGGLDDTESQLDTRVLLYYFLALLRERRLAGPSAHGVQGTIAALHLFLQNSLPLYRERCCLSSPQHDVAITETVAMHTICVQWYAWQPSYIDSNDTVAAPPGEKWVWMLYLLSSSDADDTDEGHVAAPWIFRKRLRESEVNDLQRSFRRLCIDAAEPIDNTELQNAFGRALDDARDLLVDGTMDEASNNETEAEALLFTLERAQAFERLFNTGTGVSMDNDNELHLWLTNNCRLTEAR